MERAFLEQGNYELEQGKCKAAINSYRQALARTPQSIEAHYGYGLAAEKLGRQRLAQDCFTTVVRLKSKSNSDEVILLKSPTMETTSSPEANGDPSQENNSVMAGITLFFFLLTMMLRTIVFIGYIAEKITSQSSPHVNTEATESVTNRAK